MLDRAGIERRTRHTGRMCLLDRVLAFDGQRIRCAASGHRAADHPLREGDALPAWAGIEYAAQAAALHGALLSGEAVPRAGMLGRLRGVHSACDRLDPVATDLEIGATLMHRDPAGALYAFEVLGDGALLLSGRFALVYTDSCAVP